MGTIEISDLLSYIVPLLALYIGYLHNKVISAEKDIAVNSSKDEKINEQFNDLKNDIKALTKEFHNFILSQNNKQ